MKKLIYLAMAGAVGMSFVACTTVEEHPAHTSTTTTTEERVVHPSATETRTTVAY